jgi:hypothetical protein
MASTGRPDRALADRPPEKEVWRILREHRATIDSKVEAKARAG